MRKVAIIAKGHYFKAYGDALGAAFSKQGNEVIRFAGDTYEVPQLDCDVNVIIGPNVYNHTHIENLKGIKVGVLTEQMPHIGYPPSHFVMDRFQQFIRHKNIYNLYIEWSEMNGEFLKTQFPELNIAVFPHGFLDSGLIHLPTSQCEWDICFFGSMSERREDILKELKKTKMRIYPQHEDVWGPLKYDVMRKSVLVLNMHFAESPPSFEAHRIFDIISVGRPIVSEKMNGVPSALLNNGLGRSMFRYDELLDGIHECLNRPANALDTIGSSLRFIAEHRYPMEKLVMVIDKHLAKPAAELEIYD
jgi:hypothetical protein